MDNKEGVWRTIRGRRVFIAKGESLGQAMAKSGKFKREDIRTAKTQLRRADRAEKTLQQPDNKKLRHKMTNKGLRHERDVFENRQAEKNRIHEEVWTHTGGKTRVERNVGKYSETDQRELRHEYIQKRLADYKAKKQSNNKINQFESKRVAENEIAEKGYKYYSTHGADIGTLPKDVKVADTQRYDDGMTSFKTDRPLTTEELKKYDIKDETRNSYYDEKYGKQSNNKILKLSGNNKIIDISKEENKGLTATPSIAREINNKRSNNIFQPTKEDLKEMQTYDRANDIIPELSNNKYKVKKYGDTYIALKNGHNEGEFATEDEAKDFLNKIQNNKNETIKKTKQVKNNNDWLPKATEIKEQGTSNRKEVSDNIQAHILEYYSPDYTGEDIAPEKAFVRQMEAMKEPTMWKSGQRIAEGGSYLVYNGDMSDFLDSLKINPKGKKFSEDKAFEMYTSLIGRESERLYNKIKKHEQDTINAYKKRKGK